jgi:hypothetical protein
MKAYRQQFFQQYLKYLGAGTGPRFHVSKVFYFSAGSFDVMGIRWGRSRGSGAGSGQRLAATRLLQLCTQGSACWQRRRSGSCCWDSTGTRSAAERSHHIARCS